MADHANRKTRLIEATLGGVKVTFETNCELTVPEQTLTPGGLVTKPALQREGYFDPVWYTDAAFTKEFDFSTRVSKDMTLYARWIEKTVVPVVVSFDSAGGSSVDSQTMLPGSTATKPLDPIREGYQFGGWYTDASKTKAFDFNTPVTKSLQLTAGWKAMKNVVVTFDYGYGTVKRAETKYNACAAYPPDPEERKDAVFTGWYQDAAAKNLWDFSTRVTKAVTIYAGWKEKTKYTVTFDSKGGSTVSAQTVYSGQKVVKPADPARDMYLFCGWCTDAACTQAYDFNAAVTKSFKLYAKWLEKTVIPVRVEFESNGGSSVAGQVLAKDQDKAVRPEDPTRQYYIFGGWYSDRKLTKAYDFDQIVTEDLTLYAAWDEAPVIPVRVTYDYNGEGETVVETIFQYETAPEPEKPVSRTKFFTGWYADKECTQLWNFAAPVASDLTLYAGWKAKQKHDVIFYSMGGSYVRRQTVLDQDPATKPVPDPTREGYIFCGWCTDEECRLSYNFDLPVTGTLYLYARWLQKSVEIVKVSFESNGGSAVAEQFLAKGDAAAKPADPVRQQYTFAGWYSDQTLTKAHDFADPVNADLRLYARWLLKPVTAVHVSFDVQDGTAPAVETILSGDSVSQPADPVREGYFFTGWYEDAACTKLWDFRSGIYEDTKLYAGWLKKQEFAVTFNYQYDGKTETKKVLQMDKVIKPQDPVRVTYRFIGWSRDPKGKWMYDFDTPVCGDLTLYAYWLQEAVIPVHVSFESNGGSEVSDQYLVKGQDKAARPENPVRQGYVFVDWYQNAALTEKYDFSQIVTGDLVLYAKWNYAPAIAVRITFELGDGTAFTQTVLQGDTATEPTAPVRETEFFAGWYADKTYRQLWEFDTPVTENTVLYARWIAKKELTVHFDSCGGSTVADAKVLEENKVTKPVPDPTRENYIFIGWCSDAACKKAYNFDSPVLKDMTLYARWLEKAVVAVRVSFDSCGGSIVETEVLACGDQATQPEDPVREYYTFAGWYADEALSSRYDFNTAVTEDLTLYAGWVFSPVTAVHVTFKYGDGVTPDRAETVFYGDPVVKPANPTRQEYFFTGWYEDSECTKIWYFSSRIYEDTVLYAGWRKKEEYTVSFDLNGSDGTAPEAQKVLELNTATEPAEPTWEGKRFWGWTTEKDGAYKFSFDTPITENITLYAKWLDPSVIPLIVDFDSDGGSAVPSQFVASGSNAKRPENPTKKGFNFIAWLKAATGEVFDFAEKLTSNIRLKAKWLQDPVVVVWLRFDSQGGSSLSPQLVEQGETADWPDENPERAGYHFTGWYEEPECETVFDFDNTPLDETRTVYAGWREYLDCTIQFDSNGGSQVEDQIVTEGTCVVQPPDPVKEGCIFLFWCADPAFKQVYDFGQPVQTDMTLYARWVPGYLNTVTVHFESNGGSAVEDQKIVRGEKASKPVNPARSRYRFNGWYTDETCSTAYDFETAVTADLVLYAGWTYTGGGGGGGGGGSSSAGPSVSYDALGPDGKKIGTWKKNDKGWWIQRTDGSWPKDEWVQCTWGGVLNWYFFTTEGYMASGFITDRDGKRYYLHTSATGSSGAMATGWVQIEEKWYYFNTVSDGSRGAMLVNTTTPDGYQVGADGAWTGLI